MAKTAILAIKIIADATQAAKGMQGAGREVSKFDRGMQKANRAAVGIVAGLAAVGTASFREASALQQASGAVDSVFGKQAKAVHQLARSAADDFGLSRSEYSQTAAVFGAQLGNMGVAAKKLVPTTNRLIGLGSDLAATYGGSTSDAVAAIGSLMRGEADPIERYGVGIKQVDVNARLAAKGQDKLTGSAKKTAETEARLALLMEQTTKAQGQRAREAGTAASRQEVAMAKLKNAGASLGTVLLPVVAAIAGRMATMAGYVEKNATTFKIAAGALALFAGGVFAVNAAIKAYRAVAVAATAVQWAWNVAMAANPIGVVVGLVMLFVAALIIAWKRSETFRKVCTAAFRAVQTAISWPIGKLKELHSWLVGKTAAGIARARSAFMAGFRAMIGPPVALIGRIRDLNNRVGSGLRNAVTNAKNRAVSAFQAIISPIQNLVNWVQNLINKIRGISWPSPPAWVSKVLGGGLGNLFGAYTPVGGGGARSAYAPAIVTAPGELKAASYSTTVRRLGGLRSGGGTVFIIQGALDPVAVAAQIRKIQHRGNVARGYSA